MKSCFVDKTKDSLVSVNERAEFTRIQIENFWKYRAVQMSGRYNMITESSEAMEEAGLSYDEYAFVVKHYKELSEKANNEGLVFEKDDAISWLHGRLADILDGHYSVGEQKELGNSCWACIVMLKRSEWERVRIIVKENGHVGISKAEE